MHSTLFIATIPDDARVQWAGYVGYATNKLQNYTNAERLAENVWLVNLQIDPAPLAFLVAGAVDHNIEYRLLALDDGPQWLPVA